MISGGGRCDARSGSAARRPELRGVGWELGAVSNAEWTGVPLATVLQRAGVQENAVDVVLDQLSNTGIQ